MENIMENIQEIVNAILSNGTVVAIISAIVSWLVANGLTLVLFGIKMAKMKAAEIRETELNNKKLEAISTNFKDKTNEIFIKIEERLDKLENAVYKYIDENEAEKAQEIRENTTKLFDLVDEIKSSVNNGTEEVPTKESE